MSAVLLLALHNCDSSTLSMMEASNSPDQQSVLSESILVSESLVPARDLKGVGHAEISFDGLLKDPLIIKEDLKEGCGGQLWPAGMVLARYLLLQHRSDFNNKTMFVRHPSFSES